MYAYMHTLEFACTNTKQGNVNLKNAGFVTFWLVDVRVIEKLYGWEKNP